MADEQGETRHLLEPAGLQAAVFLCGPCSSGRSPVAAADLRVDSRIRRALASKQQVGTEITRAAGCGENAFGITGEVADDAVDLGDGDAQSVHEYMWGLAMAASVQLNKAKL